MLLKQHLKPYFAVTILRQSRRLYGCWPLKGGRIASDKVKNPQPSLLDGSLVCEEKHTSGIVKLLLPPRQSRRISLRIRNC